MGNVESYQCCGKRPVPALDRYPVESPYPNYVQDPINPQGGYSQAVGTCQSAAVCGPAPAPTGRKRALLIGCNYPGSQAELNGCINDVHRMSGLLRRRYSFSPYEIRILTDDGQSPHGYSTRANIIESMSWLVEGVQPGDALFFHYSGHGGQQEDPNYAEEDGYDETILPTDFMQAGQIVDDEIFDRICAPLPSGSKLTAIMDCCHSGTGFDLPFIWQSGQWIEEDNPCHSAGDVLLISGCMDEQTSADATGNRGEAAGAMTTALCDSLEERPETQFLNCVELLEAMHYKLRERGFEQIPNLTASQQFNVGQRRFSVAEDFMHNANPTLGRHHRKTKHPKIDFAGAFGDMLSTAAPAAMFIPMATGLFGGDRVVDAPHEPSVSNSFGTSAFQQNEEYEDHCGYNESGSEAGEDFGGWGDDDGGWDD